MKLLGSRNWYLPRRLRVAAERRPRGRAHAGAGARGGLTGRGWLGGHVAARPGPAFVRHCAGSVLVWELSA